MIFGRKRRLRKDLPAIDIRKKACQGLVWEDETRSHNKERAKKNERKTIEAVS